MTFDEFIAVTLPEPHTVAVTPCTGQGAYGDVFGTPAEIANIYVEESRKVIRARDGSEVISTAQVYTGPSETIPDRSLITLPSGRETRVITVATFDDAGLGLPSHLEVYCE